MKVYMSGRDLIIEGAKNEDILGGSFRNFGGIEKRNQKTGQVVNSKGKRNFNLKVSDEYLDFFTENGCNVKEFGGNPEEGEPPIHFVKVNVNTETSNRPPKIQIVKSSGQLQDLSPESYGKIDGMFIENCDMVINFYRKYDSASLYLNLGVFKEHLDPISAKYDALMDKEGLDPNLPDGDDEDVPF